MSSFCYKNFLLSTIYSKPDFQVCSFLDINTWACGGGVKAEKSAKVLEPQLILNKKHHLQKLIRVNFYVVNKLQVTKNK